MSQKIHFVGEITKTLLFIAGMIIKDYQEKAIKDLIKDSEELLRHRGKKLVFKAPTGLEKQ